ncbi:trna-intron endonuclease [Ophiostoma piceae UAMH 11346]|uniref:Trna-intron endonuclease n=1 Tax=Ophiostoma piceae (strain UAMH 11346) TaxID=1262450 RepID=S3C672_OPHP1|nr:trna-intron endonuclease [Ophiostoma piceae UAMH 11346]
MTDHYRNLVDVVRNNLENQQDWTDVRVHSDGTDGHPRILLTGLPPRRMYIHPDEQIAILKAERSLASGQRIPQPPEYEWVLPVHLTETPSVSLFAAVFDSITALPRHDLLSDEGASVDSDGIDGIDSNDQWTQWRGPKRAKRLLLAVVQDDSSIVYYFMHDGIVKPRQN